MFNKHFSLWDSNFWSLVFGFWFLVFGVWSFTSEGMVRKPDWWPIVMGSCLILILIFSFSSSQHTFLNLCDLFFFLQKSLIQIFLRYGTKAILSCTNEIDHQWLCLCLCLCLYLVCKYGSSANKSANKSTKLKLSIVESTIGWYKVQA